MNRVASRAGIAVLLALFLLAGMGFFVAEYVMNAPQWVVFPGSPHVYTGGNIGCGTVEDRDGVLLLDLADGRTYAADSALRRATVHWLGDRYGSISAPALATHAADLAGYDLVNGVYAYGDASGTAKLTLSAQAQLAALQAIGEKKGTVAVYNYKTGEILCAVTTPNYDPDNVPDTESDYSGFYEGMYLNRFTQSVYTPGSIFKIVTLTAALEEIPNVEQMSYYCSGVLEMDGGEITCERAHGNQMLKDAFCNSCNCAFGYLASQIGPEKMESYVEAFGVVDSVSFDGIETAKGNYAVSGQSNLDIGWSGVGQHNDQVNPCAFLNFVGAIANGGKGAQPYLVDQINVGSSRTYHAKTKMGETVVSQKTAQTVAEYMRNNVQNNYGDSYFPGLSVCAKTGTAEVGGDKKPNAMLAGFVMDADCPLAFIVCVEDGGYGAQVCLPIASSVLAVCAQYVR